MDELIEYHMRTLEHSLEFAHLSNKEYVYGTYYEIEEYCLKEKQCVDKYLNYANPSTVYSKFTYVGKKTVPPYNIARPYYEKDKEGKFAIGIKVFKEKF
jgi:hypothetical protein